MTEELSERERRMVEALKLARSHVHHSFGADLMTIDAALAQYAPKPKPVPVLPSWEELSERAKSAFGSAIYNAVCELHQKRPVWNEDVYNAIRDITAKVPE